MPFTFDFDIEQDAFYQEGLEKGIEIGMGIEKREVVISMFLKTNFSPAQIANVVNVSTDFVEQLKQKF